MGNYISEELYYNNINELDKTNKKYFFYKLRK